eukprot:gene1280-421_t
MSSELKKVGIKACVLAVVVIVLYMNFAKYLTIQSLKENHHRLQAFIEETPTSSALAYVTVMTTLIGLTLPGTTAMSFAGGVLFKQPQACLLAYLGYVFGATASYTLVRFVFGDFFRKKVAGFSGMFAEFQRRVVEQSPAVVTMQVILARYMIVFTFWFTNASAALLGSSAPLYIGATAIAVMPGAWLYTQAGIVLSTMLNEFDGHIGTFDILKRTYETQDLRFSFALLIGCAFVPVILHFASGKPEPSYKAVETGDEERGKDVNVARTLTAYYMRAEEPTRAGPARLPVQSAGALVKWRRKFSSNFIAGVTIPNSKLSGVSLEALHYSQMARIGNR